MRPSSVSRIRTGCVLAYALVNIGFATTTNTRISNPPKQHQLSLSVGTFCFVRILENRLPRISRYLRMSHPITHTTIHTFHAQKSGTFTRCLTKYCWYVEPTRPAAPTPPGGGRSGRWLFFGSLASLSRVRFREGASRNAGSACGVRIVLHTCPSQLLFVRSLCMAGDIYLVGETDPIRPSSTMVSTRREVRPAHIMTPRALISGS
jgi:hypothetical protein